VFKIGAVINISGLNKDFPGGVRALRGVNLEVQAGEFLLMLGPSGAGKSTLLRCINGLVTPTAGRVELNGTPVGAGGKTPLREHRKSVGMIFQQFNLVRRLRVLDNVLCGRLYYNPLWSSCFNIFPQRDVQFALSCLDRVGLREKAYQRADTLSGGQQQRVGIARALVQQPQVILADEPVASLDPKSARAVMDILREINQEDGITVIASLHDVDLALEYARRVVGVREGAVVVDKAAVKLTPKDIENIYGGAGEQEVYDGTYGRLECVHA